MKRNAADGLFTKPSIFKSKTEKLFNKIQNRGLLAAMIIWLIAIPFAAQNSIGAISNISIRSYSIGSVIGMAPWLIGFSFFGRPMVRMRYQFIALRGLFLVILYCTAFGLTESAEI